LLHLISGPKSPSQLANIERRHVSHVSRALSELRARGVVEPMPRASRETLYRLTTAGYVVYASLSHSR
jgi:predicted transcriptional regulator